MAIAASPGATRTRREEDLYPSSDGKPMAETQRHGNQMLYNISTLTVYFKDRPDVYVAGNNFIYYEEGNPKARVSPDTYVIFGVGNRERDSYLVWKEGGKLPDIVFEVTSKKTRREDTDRKRPLYEKMRVSEYVMFDPTGDYLNPRLQGFRLENGVYVPLERVDDRLYSEMLGLYVVQHGDRMRFYDPRKGEWLPTFEEQAERVEQAVRHAEQAVRHAEQEAWRAEQEARRAEQEARRADRAEAELARLRAEMEALRRRTDA